MNQLQRTIDTHTTMTLVKGLTANDGTLSCIICGESFEEGRIYTCDDQLRDADSAATWHVDTKHGGMLSALLELPSTISGLSDIQKTVIRGVAASASDRQIGESLGGRAESTVRNHRFQLRRRLTEAQVQAAMAEILAGDARGGFVRFHPDLPVHDDRTVVTAEEEKDILNRLTESGPQLRLVRFPKKQKEKLVLLRHIAAQFHADRTYTEREVNAVLMPIYHDYVTIRRYLIDYRFMTRKPDGSEYRLTE